MSTELILNFQSIELAFLHFPTNLQYHDLAACSDPLCPIHQLIIPTGNIYNM